MGDEYPSADILGIDLSPIQPVWVPPNVRFIVDDVEADWVQPANSLDYIHVRGMGTAIKNFPRLMEQAYTCVAPVLPSSTWGSRARAPGRPSETSHARRGLAFPAGRGGGDHTMPGDVARRPRTPRADRLFSLMCPFALVIE